jgi:hypothetical protein
MTGKTEQLYDCATLRVLSDVIRCQTGYYTSYCESMTTGDLSARVLRKLIVGFCFRETQISMTDPYPTAVSPNDYRSVP